MTAETRAAVDCGTNSTRLLVVDGDGSVLARDMTITRLGLGVDERGHLDDRALARTVETIERYRAVWRSYGAEVVRIAATSAVRDADDRDRFFDAVREITGVQVEVLTGEREARVTFRGVVGRDRSRTHRDAALEVSRPVLVVDVGGGSTELVVGDGEGRVAGVVSLQLGSVRLTERFLDGDPPTGEQTRAARGEVATSLDEAATTLGRAGADPSSARCCVGVAGTITTLASLHLQLDSYEPDRVHGAWIPRPAVASLTRTLGGMSTAERARLPVMSEGREDVIFGGALIADGVVDRFGFAGLYASEADILDGLVAGA